MSSHAKAKDERIDLRVSRSAKTLLQRAAAAEALADQQRFVIDAARCNAFVAMLDAPATPKPRLRKLLKTPGILG